MLSFADLLQHGATNAWVFIPTAILLGALHGLEPGHSKTMMAAFIMAIRGTALQAVFLGVSATISHTAVVWIVALVALHYGSHWSAASEPYFQIASAALIIGIALWMLARTWREHQIERIEGREPGHHHDHHHHGDEPQKVFTNHGLVTIEIFEQGVPPRFRLHFQEHKNPVPPPSSENISIEIERPNGLCNTFHFAQKGSYLESLEDIAEPHEFVARLRMKQAEEIDNYDVEFLENTHKHVHSELSALEMTVPGYQDAHELGHANDIRRRFSNTEVTTGQIILFGLTGGLIPCPAAITVLLLCLQLKHFTLGVVLVLCFSIGLALTMVAAGVIAALSVQHVSKRWSGFGALVRRAPYFTSIVIISMGLYIGYQGFIQLTR